MFVSAATLLLPFRLEAGLIEGPGLGVEHEDGRRRYEDSGRGNIFGGSEGNPRLTSGEIFGAMKKYQDEALDQKTGLDNSTNSIPKYHDGTTSIFRTGLIIYCMLMVLLAVYHLLKCWRTGELSLFKTRHPAAQNPSRSAPPSGHIEMDLLSVAAKGGDLPPTYSECVAADPDAQAANVKGSEGAQ